MSTLFLSRKDVRDLINMPDVIEVVEQAFQQWSQGEAKMLPKAYMVLEHGDFRAMPAALPEAAGIKWVNVHPENSSLGLPTVMAILILNDPVSGYPLSVMDGTEITTYRTGATAAIASKYLARPDSHTLGIIGAGRQAYTQLLAHITLFGFRQIRVFDPNKAAVAKLSQYFSQYPVKESSLAETTACDIVCTVTPARAPVVRAEWIMPGTHINAIGADAEGKEELEPSILSRATVVVDDLRQASTGGEINVPIRRGLFKIDEVYATLGEIILGHKPGRTNAEEVTLFDSTGIAIEDLAVAKLIYDRAKQSQRYLTLDFVD